MPTVFVRLVLVAVVSLPLAILPAAASAGSYDLTLCPSGAGTAPLGTFGGGFGGLTTDRCSTGNGLELVFRASGGGPQHALATDSYGQVAGVAFDATALGPNVKLSRVAARITTTGLTSTSNSPSFVRWSGGSETQTLQTFKNLTPLPASSAVTSFSPTSPAPTVSWQVMCDHDCRAPTTGPDVRVQDIEVRATENAAPSAPTFAPTGLLNGAVQRGRRTLTLTASDTDSGVRKVELWSADRLLDSTGPLPCEAGALVPCDRRREVALTFDTVDLVTGNQDVAVVIQDAAGNTARHPVPPFELASAEGAPQAPPVPATIRPATLTLSGVPASPTPSGRTLTLSGRLTEPDGTPIASASVSIMQKVDAAGGPSTSAPATTRDDGSFSASIAATSSQVITATYERDGGVAATATARLAVRSGLTFGATRIGQSRSFRFFGSLNLDPRPRGGARVAIQVRVGRSWRDVKVARTNAAGRFRWTFRFRASVAYTFRAKLITASDTASLPSHSRALTIRP